MVTLGVMTLRVRECHLRLSVYLLSTHPAGSSVARKNVVTIVP